MGSKKTMKACRRGLLAAVAGLFGIIASGAGCESTNVVELPCEQDIKSYEWFFPPSENFKLDLLFTIDNSRSMAWVSATLAPRVTIFISRAKFATGSNTKRPRTRR